MPTLLMKLPLYDACCRRKIIDVYYRKRRQMLLAEDSHSAVISLHSTGDSYIDSTLANVS